MEKVLIINADDFGRDRLSNKAIIQSFKRGLCSSTTLMPNMAGFEEACQLSHDNRLRDYVGVHLVLTEGSPLTEKIKGYSRFCNNDGFFCMTRERPIFNLDNSEKRVLADEIRYRIIDKDHPKYHVICMDCEKTTPVDVEPGQFGLPLPQQFQFVSYKLDVYGYCLNCSTLKERELK